MDRPSIADFFNTIRTDVSGESVGALIALGLDPNSTDADGDTALHIATDFGNSAAVRVLLEAGASPDPGTPTSPLWCAAYAGHLECCRLLIAAGAKDLDGAIAAAEEGEPVYERRDHRGIITLIHSHKRQLAISAALPSQDAATSPRPDVF